MYLVEIYDVQGKLFKRRISNDLSKIEGWILANYRRWTNYPSPAIHLDDYGCGDIIQHYDDLDYVQIFKVVTVNIATI